MIQGSRLTHSLDTRRAPRRMGAASDLAEGPGT